MNDIKVGDRVRIVDNLNVPEHVRNQLGTVTPTGGVPTGEDEVRVKLDKGGKAFLGSKI